MHAIARTLIVSALALAAGVASAGPRYYGHQRGHHHHHHHHHRGVHVGGLALGLAVAVPLLALAAHHNADRTPDVVYVPPPAPLPPQPVYESPSRAAPVIYPRNGQSAVAQEADFRDCNRWATSQPAAMADASIFHRAVEACMDGRGYSLR